MNVHAASIKPLTVPGAPSSAQRLDSLTSLRFFAAFLVAVHHTRSNWAHSTLTDLIGQVGWLGVSFFFILSGFVLMWGYDPSITFKPFIIKRLIRIYPLHFITLVISLLSYLIIGNPLAGYVGKFNGALASVFLVHDWLPQHAKIRQAWNGVSWTLSCEFFFYLCAPFLFPWLLKNWKRLRLVLVVVWLGLLALSSVASFLKWEVLPDILLCHPIVRLFEFVLGAVAALQLKEARFDIPKVAAIALMTLPLAVFCYFVPEAEGYRTGATMIQLFIPGALLLVFTFAASDAAGRSGWLQNRILVFLGEASFSLYMTHALFLGAFCLTIPALFPEILESSVQGELARLTFLTYAVLISAACYYFVERPVRSFLLNRIKL